MSISRHSIGERMSQAVVHGDTVYLAGQVADDTSASPGYSQVASGLCLRNSVTQMLFPST